MKEQTIIPVYMLAGFLESGKTTMIRSMLTDEGFTNGQRTLILSCEDGMEELEPDFLLAHDAVLQSFDSPDQMSAIRLKELNAQLNPERVIIEYNTMWGLEKIGALRMPPHWEWVQVITLADATTFDSYMTNMRKLMTDPMKEADLILINRCMPSFNKSGWRRQLRALNPGANILFENLDGSTEDGVSDEDLPYDMKADIIDIAEEHYGVLYLDAMEHPERYDGKTIRIVGQALPQQDFPDGFYLFGRDAMTCCTNDIQPCGWVCQGSTRTSRRDFIRLTAKCQKVTSPDGQSVVMLHELKAEKCPPTKEKYVTFAAP